MFLQKNVKVFSWTKFLKLPSNLLPRTISTSIDPSSFIDSWLIFVILLDLTKYCCKSMGPWYFRYPTWRSTNSPRLASALRFIWQVWVSKGYHLKFYLMILKREQVRAASESSLNWLGFERNSRFKSFGALELGTLNGQYTCPIKIQAQSEKKS